MVLGATSLEITKRQPPHQVQKCFSSFIRSGLARRAGGEEGLPRQGRETAHLTFDRLGNSGAHGSQGPLRSWLHSKRQTLTHADAGGGGPSPPGKYGESIARMDFSLTHPKPGAGRGVALERGRGRWVAAMQQLALWSPHGRA